MSILEPAAAAMANELHQHVLAESKVSDMKLATPALLSIAISLKRLADIEEARAAGEFNYPGKAQS